MSTSFRFLGCGPFVPFLILVACAGCGELHHAPLEEPAAMEETPANEAKIAAEFEQLKRENADLHSEFVAETRTLRAELKRLDGELNRVKTVNEDLAKEVKLLNGTLERIEDRLPMEALLQKGFKLAVDGSLEDVVPSMEQVMQIPLHLHFSDLSEERISIIREIHFNKTTSAHEHLLELLRQANPERVESMNDPRLKVVYVVGRIGTPPKRKVIITTRKRAAERGVLPACFTQKG